MVARYRDSFYASADGEVFTTNTERELNVRCALTGTETVATTHYYGFIDLSDTVNWPHDSNGRLDFSYTSTLVDKASAARGTISLGIITRIDSTSADISYITHTPFLENDTGSDELVTNLAPSQIKCLVESGKLKYVKTNNITLNVTSVNTATPISFGAGGATFTPAVGDAILRVVTTTGGNMNWVFSALYHSHPNIGP